MRSLPGFWIRACAALVDLVAITALVALVANVAASFEYFVPLEWTVVLVYCLYNAVSLSLASGTFGKWLCGIRVTRRKGGRIPLPAALVRALLQTFFLLLLGLPFLVVAARRGKRGWHDLAAGTEVEYVPGRARRRRWTVAVMLTLIGAWLAGHALSWIALYRVHRAFCRDADVAADKQASPAKPLDVRAVDEDRAAEIAAWLAACSHEPREYLVDFAARHQVTIVGELHGKKQFLEFFNEAIPDLYRKAGVRVIALECCRSDQDAQLERLLTADQFDSDLALDVAREGIWHAWGYKEHWDVLESVWRVNRSLPADAEPLRVVGMSPPLDSVSFRLAAEGDPLRLFRVVGDLPTLIMHDAFYARRVERQAFDSGRRTLAWVGAGHCWKCRSAQRNTADGVKRQFRMGAMLCGRHGNQVGTVILHNDYSLPGIARLVETCLDGSGKDRLGFDVPESPLASLGDSTSPLATMGVDLALTECASGYVVIAPLDNIESCQWWDGFITPRMFGLYRPYYEKLCQRALKDHEEANLHMREGVRRL